MLKSLVMMVLSFSVTAVMASENSAFYTIGSVEVTKVKEEVLENITVLDQGTCNDSGLELQDDTKINMLDEVTVTEMVNLGKQIWQVVVDNKPVVTVDMPVAHALPSNANCWSDLEMWQNPKSATYNVVYKNLYGMKVVDFSFRVAYTAGGSKDGKGKYLANVSFIPANLSVLWGYNFNAQSVVGKLVNVGTKDSPTAGMSISLHWHVKTVMTDTQSTVNFFIRGDGDMVQLN